MAEPADKRIDDPEKLSLLRECRDAVEQLAPGAEVLLFGSQARGDAEAESDYDLLILTPEEPSPELKQRIRDRLFEVSLRHDEVISAFIYSRGAWQSAPFRAAPFHQRVEREGLLI
jgi:predicted nucleotidyltransferase